MKQKVLLNGLAFYFNLSDNYMERAKDRNADFDSYIEVTVLNGQRQIASYHKSYPNMKITANHFDNFINKFMTDSESRLEIQTSGKIIEDVLAETNKIHFINKATINRIDELNHRKLSKIKLRDYTKLKTFGIDGYSKMKEVDLIKYVKKNDASRIKSKFTDENDRLKALRWLARGLQIERVIGKMEADKKILEMALKKKENTELNKNNEVE